MDPLGLGKLWSTLIIAGVVVATLAVAVIWIHTDGYNKGVAATVAKMQVLIAKGGVEVKADVGRVKTLPPDKLDEELTALCLKHGGTKETCKAQ